MDDLFNYGNVKKSEFDCIATGRIGTFSSVAGTVEYIMTTATLKINADDESSKLTKHLLPIREIVDASQLDFNEILQRDLDDHRVSTKLIPYLLKESDNGPSYFPPIVAVLLPFKDGKLDGEFPIGQYFEDKDFASWCGEVFGDYMSKESLVNPNTKQNFGLNIGRYKWNSDLTKLVVIDGQHRAMALIALYRTITSKGWEKAQHGGAKFQFYYRQRIEKLFESLGDRAQAVERLKEMEFPVTILRFPDSDSKPFRIARKLFVDVNKNARQPSESRIKLLSDSSLVDIFTREVLNRSKGGDSNSLPIYAIEYDYPGEGNNYTRPGKWSALINLNMLSLAVLRLTFGPSKYVDKMDVSQSGKANWTEKNAFFKKRLDIDSNIPYSIIDDKVEYSRDDIKNDNFPISILPQLKELFWDKVGKQLSYITANIHPYKSHISALNKLKNDWLDDDTVGALAKEAIYSGVGVFWTLRDTYQHWSEYEGGVDGTDDLSLEKPDIIKAWQSVSQRELSFYDTRSKIYYASRKSITPQNKPEIDVFSKTNTNAFYVGLVLTYMTLHHKSECDSSSMDFEKVFVSVFNEALLSKNSKGEDRLDIFSTTIADPINLISKMDTKHFVFFRYFILELINCSPLFEQLQQFSISKELISNLIYEARYAYFSYLKNEEIKRLEKDLAMLGKPKTEIEDLAKANVSHKLNVALMHWFDYEQVVVSSNKIDASDDEYNEVEQELDGEVFD